MPESYPTPLGNSLFLLIIMNKVDPIILTYEFEYKTGRHERVLADSKWYDDDEYMWVTDRRVESLYEKDKIAYHYSGKIEIMNKTGWFSQFKNFQYIHDSIIDLVKYIVDGKYLVIQQSENHKHGFCLVDKDCVDFSIDLVCITVRSYASVYAESPCYFFMNDMRKIKSLDEIDLNSFKFYYKFSKYLYDIDHSLDGRKVYNAYLKYTSIKEPEKVEKRIKKFRTSGLWTYPSEDMFDEIYSKSAKVEDAQRDEEIEKLNAQIAELEKLKYKIKAKAFEI